MLEDQVLNTINFFLSVNSALLLLVAALGASEAYLDVKAVRTLHIFNGRRALADGNLQGTALGALRDRKSTRLNSSHVSESRMPSSA